jgi:hypothetical protein
MAQGTITNSITFPELARNQWPGRERPERMRELIKEYLGNQVPVAESIPTVLSHAIDPCDQRNLLVHGEMVAFRFPHFNHYCPAR